MTRISLLVATLALAACASHTPPPACRGDTFDLNPPAPIAGPSSGAAR